MKIFKRWALHATASLAGLGICASILMASPAAAQWDDSYDPSYDQRSSEREFGFGLRMGIGLTDDPSTFLLDLAVPYHSGGGISVGPRIQLGFADERSIVAPTLSFEYAHDLSDEFSGPLSHLRPLIGGGIGFLWLEKENRRGSNTDVGFLINIGLGAEYALTDRFGLASVIDFDISPEDTLGESLIFTWQILQMRFRF